MKSLLLLVVALLMTASAAKADHIGIYSDASGSSCYLGNAGFNNTATVVHKFSLGATSSRFKVTLPAGSTFFAFSTPFVPIGDLTSDLSLGYAACPNGSIPLRTIVAVLTAGIARGLPADNFSYIIYDACFGEYPATGGYGYVGLSTDYPCSEVAVESSTWGKVKSLYR